MPIRISSPSAAVLAKAAARISNRQSNSNFARRSFGTHRPAVNPRLTSSTAAAGTLQQNDFLTASFAFNDARSSAVLFLLAAAAAATTGGVVVGAMVTAPANTTSCDINQNWTPSNVEKDDLDKLASEHDAEMEQHPAVFTSEQVAEHDGSDGKPIWMSYGGVVYDVTQFIANHPGGSEKILMAAGTVRRLDQDYAPTPLHSHTIIMHLPTIAEY